MNTDIVFKERPSLLDFSSKESWICKSVYKGLYQQFVVISFFAIIIDSIVKTQSDAIRTKWIHHRLHSSLQLHQEQILYTQYLPIFLGVCHCNVLA